MLTKLNNSEPIGQPAVSTLANRPPLAQAVPEPYPDERPGFGLPGWSDQDSTVQQNQDGDTVSLSAAGRECAKDDDCPLRSGDQKLDVQERREVMQMQRRDQEVRQHEQAHIAASGRIPVSGPTYRMERGPDGRMYVTEGEVNFRLPPAQSPDEKLELAQQQRRMALAPANPSSTDLRVAAQAAQKISAARAEKTAEDRTESEDDDLHAVPPAAVRNTAVTPGQQRLEHSNGSSELSVSKA